MIRYTHPLDGPDDGALLLSDDRHVERLIVVDPDRLILLNTWDYLKQLETVQRIQSAEAVLNMVRDSGRHPSQRSLGSGHNRNVKDAV